MVTTRAKARHAAQPSTEPLEEADYPLQALQTSQRQRSFEAATFEERDLLEELGVKERPPPKGVQAIIQYLGNAYDLLLIKAGATLLTPWERFLYALTVCALAVLVTTGVAKAYQFYAYRIHVLLSQEPAQPT